MKARSSAVEAFGECLDALLDGMSISQCLEGHEQFRDELEPLLAVVAAAREAEYVPTWTPERRAQARSAYLELVSAFALGLELNDGSVSDLD